MLIGTNVEGLVYQFYVKLLLPLQQTLLTLGSVDAAIDELRAARHSRRQARPQSACLMTISNRERIAVTPPSSADIVRPARANRVDMQPDQNATQPALDKFDREMINYVLRWMPYGGPPADETLPSFGILHYELSDRIREIAYTATRHSLPTAERLLLVRALVAADAIDMPTASAARRSIPLRDSPN